MEQWGRNYADSRNPTGRVTPDMVNGQIDGMIGKPLSEMTPLDKAFYVRMYDAAHGPHPSRMPLDTDGTPRPEGYPILNPDGSSTGRLARTNSGAVKRLTWGSGGQLANAITAFEANDMPTISRAMGARHKVRNFYNNILTSQCARWRRDDRYARHRGGAVAAACGSGKSRHRTRRRPRRRSNDRFEGLMAPMPRPKPIGAQPPSAISCRARCNRSPGRRSEASTVRLRSALHRSGKPSTMPGRDTVLEGMARSNRVQQQRSDDQPGHGQSRIGPRSWVDRRRRSRMRRPRGLPTPRPPASRLARRSMLRGCPR